MGWMTGNSVVMNMKCHLQNPLSMFEGSTQNRDFITPQGEALSYSDMFLWRVWPPKKEAPNWGMFSWRTFLNKTVLSGSFWPKPSYIFSVEDSPFSWVLQFMGAHGKKEWVGWGRAGETGWAFQVPNREPRSPTFPSCAIYLQSTCLEEGQNCLQNLLLKFH